jgi:large conductance mechanosensitive channel
LRPHRSPSRSPLRSADDQRVQGLRPARQRRRPGRRRRHRRGVRQHRHRVHPAHPAPLINAVTPPESPGFGIEVIPGKESTYIDAASLISAALNFLIVAAVVYFLIVLPLNTLKERRKRGEEAGPAESTDIELLTEIRDLLRAQHERAGGERQS